MVSWLDGLGKWMGSAGASSLLLDLVLEVTWRGDRDTHHSEPVGRARLEEKANSIVVVDKEDISGNMLRL